MHLFTGVMVQDDTLLWDKYEYLLITEDITKAQVVERLGSYGDISLESRNNLTLFYVDSISKVYGLKLKSDGEEIKTHKKKTDTNTLTKSRTFISLIISFILTLSSINITQGAVNGKMEDNPKIYNSFQNVQFKTPTGVVNMPTYMTNIISKKYNEQAYSFNDPRKLVKGMTLGSDGLDKKINQDMVTGILLYPKIHSLPSIQQSTGLNVTEDQVVEAVQLSLWKQSNLAYNEFQVIETSISDSNVRTLSSAIDTWSSTQISTKPVNATLVNYILPAPKPVIEATSAIKETKDLYTIFGPYTVKSSPKMEMSVKAESGEIVDTSGNIRESIITGETFYVKYPSTFSGSSIISLDGMATHYTLAFNHGRVWLHKDFKPVVLEFNVSTAIGANGTLNANLTDVLTNMPIEGIQIDIKNSTTSITSILTDALGNISYQLPPGEYFLKINLSNDYNSLEDIPVKVNFIGDIQNINIKASRSEGIVNLYAVDATTLGSSGYAEAYVYQDNIPVKRLAFNNGECLGIMLPAGEYSSVIYKTTGDYSISDIVYFTVVAGQQLNVNILLNPNAVQTTLTLDDKKNSENWKMSFYKDSNFLFFLNTNGNVTIPFKNGAYQVIAETPNKSIKLSAFDFNIANIDSNITIPVEFGTDIVTLNFKDTILLEPIPFVVVGLFDEEHNLLQYKIADDNGTVVFDDIISFNVYFVNILAATNDVSGYSSNGNRFLGGNKEYDIVLYSTSEINSITSVDTIYHIPNVTYTGNYTYPENKNTSN